MHEDTFTTKNPQCNNHLTCFPIVFCKVLTFALVHVRVFLPKVGYCHFFQLNSKENIQSKQDLWSKTVSMALNDCLSHIQWFFFFLSSISGKTSLPSVSPQCGREILPIVSICLESERTWGHWYVKHINQPAPSSAWGFVGKCENNKIFKSMFLISWLCTLVQGEVMIEIKFS